MPKRDRTIKYTDRDFDSIKESLVSYAQRYYPDTYKDFGQAGFGALMTDYVSYIGDVLSFYMDYQANETFLDTAIEFDNIVKIAKTLGYKFSFDYASHGLVSFYATIPASLSDQTQINADYAPTIKKGAAISSDSDEKFILVEDIDFANSNNQREVAIFNETTGLVTHYAVRAVGRVISGIMDTTEVVVGEFERFRKVKIDDSFVTEIIDVIDSDGNEYFEVDYLSQNVIYKELKNVNAPTDKVSSILKPKLVSRRFTVEKDTESTTLQFGYGSERSLTSDTYGRPENVMIQKFGRPYVSSTVFDPSNLVDNDKFGISPVNTTLTIKYLKNSSLNPNASKGTLNNLSDVELVFPGTNNVVATEEGVFQSISTTNDSPIVGSVTVPTPDELRARAVSFVSSQKRAVTKQDYEALSYSMPPQFGAVKRVRALQDKDSFKKNLNLYLISEDEFGNFVETNSTIKNNLKTWITRHKMITDTVDILDIRIINLSINFTVVADVDRDKFDVLNNCITSLVNFFSVKFEVGEPLFYNDVFRELKDVDGVLDVTEVFAKNLVGGLYSNSDFSISDSISVDGRSILQGEDQVFEIKYFDRDLIGTVL
jgi:hypothetical protein